MPAIDLTDLISTTAPASRAEALDLLGDLVGATDTTSLFGDKPVKLSKPRPTWHIDGAVIVTNVCSCRTCKTVHQNLNPKVLVSMSYVDSDGNVLKTIQTSDYNLLLEVKGGPYAGKKTAPKELSLDDLAVAITYRELRIADIDFCGSCLGTSSQEAPLALLKRVLHNQHLSAVKCLENDTKASPVVKDRLSDDKAAAAEKALFDLVENSTFNGVDLDIPSDDSSY